MELCEYGYVNCDLNSGFKTVVDIIVKLRDMK